MTEDYKPIFEVTRGRIVESVHFGAIAVVNANGRLVASWGNPQLVTFTRSSAKPFQALPFIEMGGDQTYHLTSKEIAIICASHDGTDEHVELIRGVQAKVGVQESDLLCGVHPPYHLPTAEAIKARGERPTSNRHNCSGKHTGMLAHARMRGLPISDYVNMEHPIQQTILKTFGEMCAVPTEQVEIGIDGCSAPNFGVPLFNAALGFARLCDPRGLSAERAAACRRISASMMAYPDMISGSGRFDTRIMEVGNGRILAKGGAEGYMALGITAGVLGADSPGLGIAFKISDGDPERRGQTEPNSRVRPAVSVEILRQLGILSEKDLESLSEFGPAKPITNWRKLVVGESRPVFLLQKPEPV